jgi:hypothetical protein
MDWRAVGRSDCSNTEQNSKMKPKNHLPPGWFECCLPLGLAGCFAAL